MDLSPGVENQVERRVGPNCFAEGGHVSIFFMITISSDGHVWSWSEGAYGYGAIG